MILKDGLAPLEIESILPSLAMGGTSLGWCVEVGPRVGMWCGIKVESVRPTKCDAQNVHHLQPESKKSGFHVKWGKRGEEMTLFDGFNPLRHSSMPSSVNSGIQVHSIPSCGEKAIKITCV